ncbi:SDR family NAD(P)-dependent oxidoreductase [Flavobacterium rhizosphaerae]|uniref:Glucose 1-dehydrogenase n=1 Tax=Flavobacterium rhizosphaerae TaxID=3163298 RepID=A0ABW8Z2H0_9FLAO
MSTTLNGKVAIVTGASKGIGTGIAKSLAAAGASVVVNYVSDKTGADKAVSQIATDGGSAIAVQGSVTTQADVQKIFDEALKAFGRVDILVNNAGFYEFSPIADITKEHYDKMFDVNVWGVLLATQEAVKHFSYNGGSIINIGSLVSKKGFPDTVVYSATKGALDTITSTLAIELAPKKIRVNLVAPGMVETEGTATAGIKDSEFEANTIAATPLGRIGKPEDIARVVTFLAGDDAAWVTGEHITAAGGMY